MAEEHHEEVVGDIVVGGHALLLLCEVVRERGLEVGGAGGEDDLVTIDRSAFHHESDIAEVGLVQDREEVSLVDTHTLHRRIHSSCYVG